MKTILILSQIKQNESVQQITHSLELKNISDCEVRTWEIKKDTVVEFDEHYIVLSGTERLAYTDITFVIKRTWGPIRNKVLEIYRELERRNISVLNSSEFIAWSHSKVQQYQDLHEKNLLPPTLVYPDATLKALQQNTKQLDAILEQAEQQLSYPMVLKTDKGCRGDGVYLIENTQGAKALFQDLFLEFEEKTQHGYEFSSGFILQKFIATHHDIDISNYYRINIVNNQAQSAVQFQLRWVKHLDRFYKKLQEFKEAERKIIPLEFFASEKLNEIIIGPGYTLGVVGIDVIQTNDQLYLLEYNDGPNISETTFMGREALKTQASDVTALQCASFADAIADYTLLALKSDLVKNKVSSAQLPDRFFKLTGAQPSSLSLTPRSISYKSFHDFFDVKELKGCDPRFGRAHFTAKSVNLNHEEHPVYENNWYILMRCGLYRAQVEKAMSKIYQHFMVVATDISIVKKDKNYYAASRGIRDFKEWRGFHEWLVVNKEENSIGYRSKTGKIKPLFGLAEMCVLSEFFLDCDVHSGQFGVQEREDTCHVVKIDNEKALDLVYPSELESEITDTVHINDFETELSLDTLRILSVDVTKTAAFQHEKAMMLAKLASCDFSVIEAILRGHITSNKIESMQWFVNYLVENEAMSKEMAVNNLEILNSEDANKYSINAIVSFLKEKHQNLSHLRISHQASPVASASTTRKFFQ